LTDATPHNSNGPRYGALDKDGFCGMLWGWWHKPGFNSWRFSYWVEAHPTNFKRAFVAIFSYTRQYRIFVVLTTTLPLLFVCYRHTQVLGVGGFDSWRYDQPSLYFFDVATDPARPRYLTSVTPTEGAVADDLVRLPQASGGGFLVSLMGNKQGTCNHQRGAMRACVTVLLALD
jgi:hypothetical protein